MTVVRCLALVVMLCCAPTQSTRGQGSVKVNAKLSTQPLTYTEAQADSLRTLTFENVGRLTISDSAAASGVRIIESTPLKQNRHRIVLRSGTPGVHRIEVLDATKKPEYQRLGVNIDSRLTGTLKETVDELRFSDLSGGTPPYKLLFYRNQEYIATQEGASPEGMVVPKMELLSYHPEGGVFSVRMVDANDAGEFYFNGQTISILQKEAHTATGIIWYGAGAAAFLLLGYLIVQANKRGRKQEHLEKVRQEIQQEPSPGVPAAPPPTTNRGTRAQRLSPITAQPSAAAPAEPTVPEAPATRETLPPEPAEEPEKDTDLPAGEPAKPAPEIHDKPAMRISRRANHLNRLRKNFAPDGPKARFLHLPMNRHWDSSMITDLYLGTEAVDRLDEFLHRENVDKIVATADEREQLGWERNETVPEIGGMLMGQFERNPGELSYRVSIEKFVPLEAKYQSVTKVEIDPVSLARDLGDAQDENPDLIVVGWFHTHPGHGLFLSRPDLKIHYSHFHRPYHLAMEIDSLSERLDTGFFTYLPSGHMNNSGTLRPHTPWFSWSKIRQQQR